MKKVLSYAIIMILFFLLNISAINAECSYTEKAELNKKAANVKIDYEIRKEEVSPESLGYVGEDPSLKLTISYIDLHFYNITEELYVEGVNTDTNEMITKTAADMVDGVSTITYDDLSFVRKFTFKVYASDTTACPGETLKTLYITLPKHNEYYDKCEGENDFYLCKEFITTNNVDLDTFYSKYEDYYEGLIDENGENEKPESTINKILDFVVEYKYFIGGAIIIAVGTAVVIRYIKTKKQRELGL